MSRRAAPLADDGGGLIVIAWAEDGKEWDGEPFRADAGRPPRYVDVVIATACVWLLDGSAADVDKARAFVTSHYGARGAVYVYPVTEPDPLKRAKREIMTRARCPRCGAALNRLIGSLRYRCHRDGPDPRCSVPVDDGA